MNRILFLSTVFPRAYEPTRGVYCRRLCTELAKSRKVKVISPRSWLEATTRPEPWSSAVAGAMDVEYPTYFRPPGVLHSFSAEFLWASMRGRIRRTVEDFRPDAVIGYWAHPDGEIAVRAAKTVGASVGLIVGGSDVLLLPKDPRRRAVVAKALTRADAVFAVNRDLRERVVSLGVEPSKAHVLNQGLAEVFAPGRRDEARKKVGLPLTGNVLLWVGGMNPVKGLEVLVSACARLRGMGTEFTLVLVGAGPSLRSVQSDVAQNGLADCTRFVGPVENDRLPDWYRAANLTLLTSHSEGIPNVLRESLACGTPYVATRVGGVAELYDGPEVRLTPPANPIAFAEAVNESLRLRLPVPPLQFAAWAEYAEALLQRLPPPIERRLLQTSGQLDSI